MLNLIANSMICNSITLIIIIIFFTFEQIPAKKETQKTKTKNRIGDEIKFLII